MFLIPINSANVRWCSENLQSDLTLQSPALSLLPLLLPFYSKKSPSSDAKIQEGKNAYILLYKTRYCRVCSGRLFNELNSLRL